MVRVADLKDPGFGNRIVENVPVVLEWSVGEQSCKGARESPAFACHGNSDCVDFDIVIKDFKGIHILAQDAQLLSFIISKRSTPSVPDK